MDSTFLAVALAASLAVGAEPIVAQTSRPIVGTWSIEYERGRRVENGEMTPIMGAGELRIVQEGDSLVATLVVPARPDGTVPPPATFGGHSTPAGEVFVQTRSVQLNVNGEQSTHDLTLTWTLQASGDVLTGTLASELPMMPEPLEPSPVKGTRKRD